MKDFTIAMYCFLDDLLLKIGNKNLDKRRKLSDSQVIATVILAARYFYGNQSAACGYLQSHHGFQYPDRSNFNRILHSLTDIISDIFFHLGLAMKHLNLNSVYLIDSFPVAVCKNIRIRRSKIIKGEQYRGFNASKKEYFYGFKVHIITTGDGIPVEFLVTAGSIHDNTALQGMNFDLPTNSDVYGDSAYVNEDYKQLLAEFNEINLKAATRKNQKERNTWQQELENKYFRKQIENTFAQITARFPKKIHAVTAEGFLLKILCFIIAFILEKNVV